MKTTYKLIQRLLVLAIAISTTHAFAADKTNEGAKTTRPGEVVTKSKDGVEVHSMKEPKSIEKSDREYREKKGKEKKGK